MDVASMFDMTGWDMLSADVQTQIFSAFEDAWGSNNAWQTFQSLGYDMTTYVASGIANGSLQVKNEAGELVLTLKDGTKVALGKQSNAKRGNTWFNQLKMRHFLKRLEELSYGRQYRNACGSYGSHDESPEK